MTRDVQQLLRHCLDPEGWIFIGDIPFSIFHINHIRVSSSSWMYPQVDGFFSGKSQESGWWLGVHPFQETSIYNPYKTPESSHFDPRPDLRNPDSLRLQHQVERGNGCCEKCVWVFVFNIYMTFCEIIVNYYVCIYLYIHICLKMVYTPQMVLFHMETNH